MLTSQAVRASCSLVAVLDLVGRNERRRAEGTVEGKVDGTPVTLSLAITGDAVTDAAVLAQFPNVATGCRFSVQPCGEL
jgi:hypothetical protein